MTDHEYDPKLPYVLENTLTGDTMGRATSRLIAKNFSAGLAIKIIDTTPKPRIPDDAQWITWLDSDTKRRVAWYWGGESRKWWDMRSQCAFALEALPGVTPDTVFTVLDEREI